MRTTQVPILALLLPPVRHPQHEHLHRLPRHLLPHVVLRRLPHRRGNGQHADAVALLDRPHLLIYLRAGQGVPKWFSYTAHTGCHRLTGHKPRPCAMRCPRWKVARRPQRTRLQQHPFQSDHSVHHAGKPAACCVPLVSLGVPTRTCTILGGHGSAADCQHAAAHAADGGWRDSGHIVCALLHAM